MNVEISADLSSTRGACMCALMVDSPSQSTRATSDNLPPLRQAAAAALFPGVSIYSDVICVAIAVIPRISLATFSADRNRFIVVDCA